MGIKEDQTAFVARLWRVYHLARNAYIKARDQAYAMRQMAIKYDLSFEYVHSAERNVIRLGLAADFAFAEASAAQRKLYCKPHGQFECPACEDIAAMERRAAHAS